MNMQGFDSIWQPEADYSGPMYGVVMVFHRSTGNGTDPTSSDTAWEDAVNDVGGDGTPPVPVATDDYAPGGDTVSIGGSISQGVEISPTPGPTTSTAQYEATQIAFLYYSPHCYMHVWWKAVATTIDANGTNNTTTTGDVELTASGVEGYCLPSLAAFNVNDPSTWNLSDPQATFSNPKPVVDSWEDYGNPSAVFGGTSYVGITLYKWSAIPGYIPPDDGSANGFPPPEP